MDGHLYALGDFVCFRNRPSGARLIPEAFEIIALLPLRKGAARYRVRGEGGPDEHIVLEEEVELVSSLAANSNIPAALRRE